MFRPRPAPVGLGQYGHLPGEPGGFQSQHGEGGVGSSEAPLRKGSLLISHVSGFVSAGGHYPFHLGTHALQEENAD